MVGWCPVLLGAWLPTASPRPWICCQPSGRQPRRSPWRFVRHLQGSYHWRARQMNGMVCPLVSRVCGCLLICRHTLHFVSFFSLVGCGCCLAQNVLPLWGKWVGGGVVQGGCVRLVLLLLQLLRFGACLPVRVHLRMFPPSVWQQALSAATCTPASMPRVVPPDAVSWPLACLLSGKQGGLGWGIKGLVGKTPRLQCIVRMLLICVHPACRQPAPLAS